MIELHWKVMTTLRAIMHLVRMPLSVKYVYILLITALNFANPLYLSPDEVFESTEEPLAEDDGTVL